MKSPIKYLAIMLFAATAISSCKKDDNKLEVPLLSTILEVKSASDVVADTGSLGIFTYYSLSENKIIGQSDSATTKWDLAFKGTNIYTNSGTSGPGSGGAIISDGIFDEIKVAPSSGYATDETSGLAIPSGSDNGWYHYTGSTPPATHAILPIAGKVLMIHTADGKYAKVEILSYYIGAPNATTSEFADLSTRPAGRFYSFRFVYQPDGSTSLD